MKKYKSVEINCHKNIVRKIPIYAECYRNIYPTQLDEKLNQLVKAGWTHFEIVIDGNKQQKVLANYQCKSNGENELPGRSMALAEKSGLKPLKSRKNDDSNRPHCPKCNLSKQVIEIVYGFPTSDTMDLAERGKLKLGGCCVSDNDPNWHCKACQLDFNKKEEA